MGLDKGRIDSEEVFSIAEGVFRQAKEKNMTCVIGGTISLNSLVFLRRLSGILDRYETRKVCFSCKDALKKDPAEGINKALEFELLWLQNKQNYYKAISEEDQKRMLSLKERGK
jgi:hypothetical protein